MSESRPTGLLGAWSALGLAGSLLIALVAPQAVDDRVVGWWYAPALVGSQGVAVVLVWVGMGMLALAWLAIARGAPTSRRQAAVIASAWVLPLALAPPLFSRDVYSYLAQGALLHLGHDPYRQAPTVLAGLGHAHVLAAVSPFWRHTTAPYGPLFLELIALIVGICGQHLIAGVLLCRVLDLIGLGLVAVFLPRVAQALGGSGGRALWLGLASPLVLFALIAPAHNDLLMVGLLVCALSVALRGNPLLGIAICVLAATIKVPAFAGAVFIAICWARTEAGGARLRLLAAAVATAIALPAIVTLAGGVSLGWLGSAVFSTPARVRLAITPATGVGYTIAWLAHAVSVPVAARSLEGTVGLVATAAVALAGLGLLWRARVPTLVVALATTLLLAAAGGPAAWPWYLSWGLVALAAVGAAQRSAWLLAALVLEAFLVKPNGILALPLGAAPAVVLVYLALAGGAAWAWRRRLRSRGRDVSGRVGGDGGDSESDGHAVHALARG